MASKKQGGDSKIFVAVHIIASEKCDRCMKRRIISVSKNKQLVEDAMRRKVEKLLAKFARDITEKPDHWMTPPLVFILETYNGQTGKLIRSRPFIPASK